MEVPLQYEKANRITVGELRQRLAFCSDCTELTIGPASNGEPLILTRVKMRGKNLVQIELADAAVMMEPGELP